MTLFLIKSTICMGILLAVYHLLLEHEKMHNFNRIYLLFSMCFALVIPFIEIETVAETVSFSEISTFNNLPPPPHVSTFTKTFPATTNSSFFLFTIYFAYGIIVLILLFRFVKNLSGIRAKITSNPTVNYKKAKLVLLNEKILPHTFLHYIFVNKDDYEHQHIEKELLEHELAHVHQKHSLDILFVEIFKIAGWFNPLTYLFEKAIKMNHEFLADAAVIRLYRDIPVYQHLLLHKASQSTPPYLMSPLNFSITKKRLIMMTKTISPVQVLLKKAVLIPLFLMLVFVFATKTLSQEIKQDQQPDKKEVTSIQNKPSDPKNSKVLTREDSLRIIDNLYKGSSINIRRKNNDGTYTKITYDKFTDEEKLRIPFPRVPVSNPPNQDQLNAWTDPTKYGVWLDGKRIENAILKNYQPADFGSYFMSRLAKNATNYGKHDFQVDIETLPHFEERQERMRKVLEVNE